jgi:Tfp pilus assembly PilM family ATPase
MAKQLTSVIGLDLGRYSLKSVLLQRKGNDRFVITNFGSMPVDDEAELTPELLGKNVKTLLKQMGGSAKTCAIAVSSQDALLRLIEQPETPPDVLRDALRLNGQMLLNQDCRDYVLDCDQVHTNVPIENIHNGATQKRYLVGGLPRKQVSQINDAFSKSGFPTVATLQLAPISIFNAFEFAQEETFNKHAFFLLDLGHSSSTMIIGVKRELVLIRTIDFGGRALVETLSNLSGESREIVLHALEQEDEVMVENARMALMALTREVGSSIGFFEGRREETIGQLWVSGGVSKNRTVLRDVNISSSKRARFAEEMFDLSVATGAAAEALKTA